MKTKFNKIMYFSVYILMVIAIFSCMGEDGQDGDAYIAITDDNTITDYTHNVPELPSLPDYLQTDYLYQITPGTYLYSYTSIYSEYEGAIIPAEWSGDEGSDDSGTDGGGEGCLDGYVDDCADDDCCPESWIADGYGDCEDQDYGCDLTCYDNDGGDCDGRSLGIVDDDEIIAKKIGPGINPSNNRDCEDYYGYGYVDDCSGDGDCCPSSWIGDGLCDGTDQQWGCDLTCYSNDGGDCSGSSSCSSTTCGYYIMYWGYSCSEVESYFGYSCSTCQSEGYCDESCSDTSCGYWLTNGSGYTCSYLESLSYDCSVCDSEGECTTPGCTDSQAISFNDATSIMGSGYESGYYDSSADTDDGSCIYQEIWDAEIIIYIEEGEAGEAFGKDGDDAEDRCFSLYVGGYGPSLSTYICSEGPDSSTVSSSQSSGYMSGNQIIALELSIEEENRITEALDNHSDVMIKEGSSGKYGFIHRYIKNNHQK